MCARERDSTLFASLHVAGSPLVLFNIWDVGSAKAVAGAGASAIATGSWSVAAARGLEDGEQLEVEEVLRLVDAVANAVELPLSVDFEAGYAGDAPGVGRNIARLWQAGAIGCNLEDGLPAGTGIRALPEQLARLRAARDAAPGMFINARTDFFLQAPAQQHASVLEAALQRAKAYEDAGANGLFMPGLQDPDLIGQVVAASSLPVNVMMTDKTPTLRELAALGVARVSHGPGPYLAAMAWLRAAAAQAASC